MTRHATGDARPGGHPDPMVRIGYGPGVVSPAELRRDPRKRRQVWVSLAVMAAVGLVVMTWSITTAYYREAPLRGDGLVTTQAQVLAFLEHTRSADEVEVRFAVPGRADVTTEIPVTRSFRAGTTTAVRYDPADPATVRTAEDWRPVYSPLRPLFPLAAAVVLGVALVRARAAHRAVGRR